VTAASAAVPAAIDVATAAADALPRILIALGLGVARAVPIVWLVPAFGGAWLPVPLRLGMGLLLASLGLPHLVPAVDVAALASIGPLGWPLMLAREALIGATVGLVISFLFRAAEAAGGLVDLLRGASFGEVLSPISGARTSPIGALYLLLATVIFVELGGLGRLAVALARSYQAVPVWPLAPGAVGAPFLPTPTPTPTLALGLALRSSLALVLVASGKLIESAVGLAAPVIVALLLADLVLGALGRITPAVPVYFVAMPLKALLGVGLVLLGLASLDAALVAGVPAWLRFAERGLGF
jgi:type III secretory pathway component EscT